MLSPMPGSTVRTRHPSIATALRRLAPIPGLAGSAVDLLNSNVGIHACHRMFGHVTVAAEDLDASIDHDALLFGEPPLRLGGVGDLEFARCRADGSRRRDRLVPRRALRLPASCPRPKENPLGCRRRVSSWSG